MAADCTTPTLSRIYPLRREIAWALAFKALALVVLYFLFFGPSHRMHVTPGDIAALFAAPAQTQGTH